MTYPQPNDGPRDIAEWKDNAYDHFSQAVLDRAPGSEWIHHENDSEVEQLLSAPLEVFRRAIEFFGLLSLETHYDPEPRNADEATRLGRMRTLHAEARGDVEEALGLARSGSAARLTSVCARLDHARRVSRELARPHGRLGDLELAWAARTTESGGWSGPDRPVPEDSDDLLARVQVVSGHLRTASKCLVSMAEDRTGIGWYGGPETPLHPFLLAVAGADARLEKAIEKAVGGEGLRGSPNDRPTHTEVRR